MIKKYKKRKKIEEIQQVFNSCEYYKKSNYIFFHT